MAGRKRRIVVVAFAALAVLAFGGIYVLSIVLSDHVAFRQGGPAYAIIVTSKTVHDFPRFTAAGRDADFTYSARDGTAPGQITMTYSSKDVVNALDRKYRTYCQRQGYASVPESERLLPSRLGCDAPDYRIQIDLQPRGTTTLVTVVFWEQ